VRVRLFAIDQPSWLWALASKPLFENCCATWPYVSMAEAGSLTLRYRSPSFSRALVSSASACRCFRYSFRALSYWPFWTYFCACSSVLRLL